MADAKKSEPMVDIYQGDTLAVTAQGKKIDMTPNDLLKLGHPNQFKVLLIFGHGDENEAHVVLKPCCYYFKRGANDRCGGHALKYFEKTAPPDPKEEPAEPRMSGKRHPDDRNTRASIPFIGEIASVEYNAEEQRLTGTLLKGESFEVEGAIAKWAAGMLAQQGWI